MSVYWCRQEVIDDGQIDANDPVSDVRPHQSNCFDESNDQFDRSLVGQSLAAE